jgi:hypothetical protein
LAWGSARGRQGTRANPRPRRGPGLVMRGLPFDQSNVTGAGALR